MSLPHERGVLFKDTIETVHRVKRLLEVEGIHTTAIPLPFHSHASAPDTGWTPALRYALLVVSGEDCLRALAVIAKHRGTIDQWSGFPSDNTNLDGRPLGVACPGCDTAVNPEDEICPGCGLRLADAGGQA